MTNYLIAIFLHSKMFDPLDLYTAEEEAQHEIVEPCVEVTVEKTDPEIEDDTNYAADVIELPSCFHASPEILLATLKLLRPVSHVNFGVDNKNLTEFNDFPLLDKLVDWYSQQCPNPNLNTREKLLKNIPLIPKICPKDSLLGYYTSILQYFGKNPENNNEVNEIVLKEVSLRIAENCGRTAQPASCHDFKLNNLDKVIRLNEPSLTADNLGWKTWGSSLVLADIVVDLLHNESLKIQGDQIRTLELGAGTGLVGIAWAEKWRSSNYRSIKSEIFLTDLPEIVDNLKKNVMINELDSFVRADILDWTNPNSFIDKYGDDKFDIILVADPIYSPQHPEWVVNMIGRFLKSEGICHLQIPVRERYSKERAKLWKLLHNQGLITFNERLDKGKDDWGEVEYIYKAIKWEK